MSRTSITDSVERVDSEDVDRFYRALADHRRRIAIRVLNERTTLAVDELAASIAERETGEVDGEAVEVALVHQHLPLLSEAGIVEHDPDAGRVTIEQPLDEFLPPTGPVPQ